MRKLLIILLLLPGSFFAQQLQYYHCMSSQYEIGKWLKNLKSFDSSGVVMQQAQKKNQYHPLTIGFLGIMAYDAFRETGNKEYEKYCRDQIAYFRDTSKVTIVDSGRGMGLPYRYKHRTLESPWYSGMAQGVGVSYILRYVKLTGDTSAMKIARQLVYFMLRDEKKGGALKRTKEGYLCIEEYPKYTGEPHVLNGFINALIGLHEYTLFAPSDTMAKRLHDEIYSGLLSGLHLYDMPAWTAYNRLGKGVNNQYMRYEIAEMQHLYNLYKEKQFLHQQMLWSAFAWNKKDNLVTYYHDPDYQFAIPVKAASDTSFDATLMPVLVDAKASVKTIVPGKKIMAEIIPEKPVNILDIEMTGLANKNSISCLVKPKGKKKTLQITNTKAGVRIVSAKPIKSVKIEADIDSNLVLKKIRGLNPEKDTLPQFTFIYSGQAVKLEKNSKYILHYKTSNLPKPVIFYRTAKNAPTLKMTNWNAKQYQDDFSYPFFAAETGYYEFMFVFTLEKLNPSFSDFSVELVK